jgi:hypothetical protein
MGTITAAPCTHCCEDVPLGAACCQECGRLPGAETEMCGDCAGEGSIEVYDRSGINLLRRATCKNCDGDGVVEAPYLAERGLALGEKWATDLFRSKLSEVAYLAMLAEGGAA